MAKKVRFRLWFHKLNIKRFSNSYSHRKRRNVPSSPPHPLHGFSATSASIQARHSFSSPDQNGAAAILPSPSHSLPLTFSSPRHASSSSPGFRATFSVPRHSFPATFPPRHSCKASKPSQNQAIFHTSILLSPINHKAMDIPFPSGGSSPATFLQSPIFQVSIASPAARVSSPPMRKPHSQAVLFRSPLHPLSHQILANLSTDARAMSKNSSANPSREARNSARSSKKSEISANSSRIADVSACHSQAQSAKSNLITAKHSRAQQRRSIGASSTKQSPLIVDCGCRPNLSSSFRKTKKTLQACGSCSSGKPVIIPVYDHRLEGATQMLKGRSSMNISEESKNSMAACISGKHDTGAVLAKQGHHSQEDSQKTHQLKKRKKKMDVALSANPNLQANQHEFARTSCLMTSTNEEINREHHKIKSKRRGVEDADCNGADTKLAPSFRLDNSSGDTALFTHWEKEFSSITSEDTFFSSFERSRPSFSSNSSSECFDKKLSYVSNPASVSANLVSKEGGHHNLSSNLSCKSSDPLVEVSFHDVDVDGEKRVAVSRKGSMSPTCAQVASQCPPWINANHGMKRACFSSLVEIKEDLPEDGDTNTAPSGNAHGSRRCKSGLKTLNLQKKLSFNPDYTSSSHSDYYANTHTDNLQSRSALRVWRKSDVHSNNGGRDTGSARIRRRAQLQAKWRLHEEQIYWQSSDDSEGDYDDRVSCSSSKLPPRAHRRDDVHMQSSTMSRRRKTREIKPKCNKSVDSPAAATSKVASKVLDNSASCDANRETLPSSNTASKCDGGDGEKMSQHVHLSRESSFVTNPRLVDSVAVVKCSKDPLVDFRDSMVDMIIERQLYSAEDLKELLQCFLSLNSHEHYDIILQAFAQVWAKVFHES